MGKRFLLFLLTNILVMTTVVIVWSIITSFTDIGGQIDVGGDGLGINLTALAVISILIGFIGSFFSLAISRIVAKKMMKVNVLDPESSSLTPKERAVVDRVHTYARRAGMMHMPEVGIYNSQEVNAFATGPTKKRSLVAVSSGLLDSMDGDAVEGVLAHEVAHISNGDMVTMTLLQGVVNTFVVFFSRIAAIIVSRFVRSEMQFVVRFAAIIVFQILFSILGSLVVMAYSRHREYHADRGGADLAGKDKMAHALRSLQSYVGRANVKDGRDDSTVQTMKINGKTGVAKLFSSHPDIEERLARLERM